MSSFDHLFQIFLNGITLFTFVDWYFADELGKRELVEFGCDVLHGFCYEQPCCG